MPSLTKNSDIQSIGSIYHGHSTVGIGIDGSGKSAVDGGEQYIAVDDKLNNKQLLTHIKPWVTLDFYKNDQRKLSDDLESWSFFTAANLTFVCRLSSAGTHGEGNRSAYFSHSRAWQVSTLSKKDFDPGLYIGSSTDYEKPWRDDDLGLRIQELSSIDVLQRNILEHNQQEKTKIKKYLAYLFYAILKKKKLILLSPLDNFKSDSKLHKAISVSRALLPQLFRDKCKIRIYCYEMLDFFIKECNFIAIPNYLQKDAEKLGNANLLITINGDCIYGQYSIDKKTFSLVETYANAAVDSFFDKAISIPFFSIKTGDIFSKNAIARDNKTLPFIVNYSSELIELYQAPIDNRAYFLKKHLYLEEKIEWDVFLDDDDLSIFREIDLLKFLLEDIHEPQAKLLQNRIEEYLSKSTTINQTIDSDNNELSSDIYFKRTDELANHSSIITDSLILKIFGNDIPKNHLNIVRKLILKKVGAKSNLPDDITDIATNLDYLIDINKNDDSFLREVIDKIIIERPENIITHLNTLKESLSKKNYNHISSYFLYALELELVDNSKYYSIVEHLVEHLDTETIDQAHLQVALVKLINNKLIYCSPYTFTFPLDVALKFSSNNLSTDRLEKLWDNIKSHRINHLNNEQKQQLLSDKYEALKPEYLLDDNNKIEDSWINTFPSLLINNKNIREHLDIKQLLQLILTLNEKKQLKQHHLILLAERVDNEIKKNNTNESIVKKILQLLLEKNLWLAWHSESKLDKTIKHKLAKIYITDLSDKIYTLEIWELLINDLKFQGGLTSHDLIEDNLKPKNIIPIHKGIFIKKQFDDLLSLSTNNDKAVAFPLHHIISQASSSLIHSSLIQDDLDQTLVKKVGLLAEIYTKKYKPDFNSEYITDIKDLEILPELFQEKINERIPTYFIYHLKNSPIDQIKVISETANSIQLYDNNSFKTSLNELLEKLNDNNKLNSIIDNLDQEKYNYSIPNAYADTLSTEELEEATRTQKGTSETVDIEASQKSNSSQTSANKNTNNTQQTQGTENVNKVNIGEKLKKLIEEIELYESYRIFIEDYLKENHNLIINDNQRRKSINLLEEYLKTQYTSYNKQTTIYDHEAITSIAKEIKIKYNIDSNSKKGFHNFMVNSSLKLFHSDYIKKNSALINKMASNASTYIKRSDKLFIDSVLRFFLYPLERGGVEFINKYKNMFFLTDKDKDNHSTIIMLILGLSKKNIEQHHVDSIYNELKKICNKDSNEMKTVLNTIGQASETIRLYIASEYGDFKNG